MRKFQNRVTRLVPVIFFLLVLSACVTGFTRNPVPLEYYDQAEVVNIPGVRVWGDERSELLRNDILQSIKNENKELFPRGPRTTEVISGFNASGAR